MKFTTTWKQLRCAAASVMTASLLVGATSLSATAAAKLNAEGYIIPQRQNWSFAGVFGRYDRAQLQRGFKVFHDVCSQCHKATHLTFRELSEPGGPEFTPAQIKALAATYKIKDGPNDQGDMFLRPGKPSDAWPWTFPNDEAAKSALGAVPPDMSLLAKARTVQYGFPYFLAEGLPFFEDEEQGPDYIYSLIKQGYRDPPKGMKIPNGLYYNAVIQGSNHLIRMPSPLAMIFDSAGKPNDPKFYADGTPVTEDQVARDVSAFLMWAAEPKLEERKRMGFNVMVFLGVFATLLYLVKRKIWAGIHDESPSI